MSALLEIPGDLLDSDAQYIAHQCNCVTTHGAGLSKVLFARFSWADVYSNRRAPSQPGTIEVFGNGREQRFVVNMYAQYQPSRPRSARDSAGQREQWFVQCLEQIAAIPGVQSVAFPYGIGCGLAGGNWERYRTMLEEWADKSGVEQVILARRD